MTSLPSELYHEIISYLWDDKNTLRACSCAGRILTVASQKLLFNQIILDPCRNSSDNFGGTSSALHKLLEKSPHIADYVQCLQIFDIDEYPDSSDDDGPSEDAWLANDTFLPLFAPLFCNLKAFVLLYVPNWDSLREQVRRSLQDLIRIPSLVYVDIAPRPTIVFKESFSNNLKHLVLRVDDWTRGTSMALIQPSSCSESPIYLETLCISKAEPEFLTHLTSDPNFRFKTNYLRRLLLDVQTDKTFHHFALGPLLQSCRETLEHLTFMPCIKSLSQTDISAPRFTPIDLSQLTALNTLTLLFVMPESRATNSWDPLWCFSNLLRSVSSKCHRLEDITVVLELYEKFTDTWYWNETCGILLNPSRFPRLTKLTIYAFDSDDDGASVFLESLENSENFALLRARPGIEVVTSVKDHVDWISAPDKRWENAILAR